MSRRPKAGKITVTYADGRQEIKAQREFDQRRVPRTKRGRYRKYLRSPEWKAKRREAFKRDGYQCLRCGCGDKHLVAHHTTYAHFGDERLDEIQTLCHECHDALHRGGWSPA